MKDYGTAVGAGAHSYPSCLPVATARHPRLKVAVGQRLRTTQDRNVQVRPCAGGTRSAESTRRIEFDITASAAARSFAVMVARN